MALDSGRTYNTLKEGGVIPVAEKTVRHSKYEPYSKEHIGKIRRTVGNKNQDNKPVGDESYLKMALQACKEFNETFEDKTFD